MKIKIIGKLMEQTSYTKKDGTVVPQGVIYSDGGTVKVDNLDCSKYKMFEDSEFPCYCYSTQYGTRYMVK